MSKAFSGEVKVGQKAPDFTAMNDKGEKVKLGDLKGKKVVLYFYPKDDTPGCTKEACAFRDGIDEIKSRGAVVMGVCHGSILPDYSRPHPTCYGQMLNGICTEPMF